MFSPLLPGARPPHRRRRTAAEPPAKSELPRKFLLFFDFGFNNERGVRKAREAALRFLDSGLRPDDEVGLISYSQTRGLSFNEFLTVEHAKVRQAVEDLGVKPIAGRAEDFEQEYWRRAGETIQGPTDSPAHNENHPHSWVNPTLDWRRQESKNFAQNYLRKLTVLAQALRYVPGRKNIVFFSTGIASSIIYGNSEGTPFGEQSGVGYKFDPGDYVLKALNEELLHELATSSCSIYSFDTREAAKVPTLFDYDNETFNSRNRDIFNTYGPQQNTNLTFKDEPITGLYSLTKLAKDTGGQYFANINQYGHNLESLETMTGTYYVLGYPIVETWDGEFHPIKVSVARPGCEVRAQAGYFNPRPFSEISPLERQLQLIDLALSDNPVFQTPLSAGLQIFPGTDADRSTQILMRLPVETIDRLSPGRSEIETFVFDPQDAIVELRRSEEDLSRFREKTVFYSSRIALGPGTYKCRMIVRSLETGAAAVATASAFIPERPARTEPLKLLTPLLLTEPGGAVYLEARSKLSATGGVTTGPALSPYPFDAENITPLFGPIPAGRPSIRAVLPCRVSGVPIEEIALRAALIDGATGARTNLADHAARAQSGGGRGLFSPRPRHRRPPAGILYPLLLRRSGRGARPVLRHGVPESAVNEASAPRGPSPRPPHRLGPVPRGRPGKVACAGPRGQSPAAAHRAPGRRDAEAHPGLCHGPEGGSRRGPDPG